MGREPRQRQQAAAAARNAPAPVSQSTSILDMPNDQFQGALRELASQGLPQDRIDDLMRQYRSANSPLAPINEAAATARQEADAGGRKSIVGGMFTKDAGATGMDAVRSMRPSLTAGLLGALQGGGQAVDAPMAAAQGLIPQGDMALEALGTAGAAMTGGGAAVVPDGSLRAGIARKARMNAAGRIDDYAGGHTAPLRDGYSAPLSNLAGDIYPDDIYSPQAAQYYGTGDMRLDRQTAAILQRYRDKPDAEVPIYRAAPLDAEDINAGDWVTLNREYARQHGDAYLDTDYNILEGRAKAGDLFTDGNSMHEFGWSPIASANADTSGGLLATAASDALTPSQQMARRILDMRAAGQARDVTDDMMAQADPQYMFNNTPLPMDEDSRYMRSRAQGFDTKAFHGGRGGYDRLDPEMASGKTYDTGIWAADDPDISATYNGSVYDGTQATYPLTLRSQNYGVTDWQDNAWGDGNPQALLLNPNEPRPQKFGDIYEDWQSWASTDNAARAANEQGLDGLRVNNVVDIGPNIYSRADNTRRLPETGTSFSITNPTTARSKFARFDPEFAHLSNLSAANVSPTAGSLATIGADDEEQRKRDIVQRLMPSAQNIIRRQ